MILAIDTATRWTGLALFDGKTIIAEQGWRGTHTQTVELAPSIAALLTRSGLAAVDLQAIAIAIGPGSYTSLRVGLATVAKGLSLAHQIPLIGVPTLDIIAAVHWLAHGSLLVAVEAGRSRVVAGLYRWQENKGWQRSEWPIVEAGKPSSFTSKTPPPSPVKFRPETQQAIRAAKNRLPRAPLPPFVVAGYRPRSAGSGSASSPSTQSSRRWLPTTLRDPSGN